jgi:hypothetical protein
MILLLYVDDMIITRGDKQEVSHIKDVLKANFDTIDLNFLWFFLRIEVVYSPSSYLLSQTKYAAEIIEQSRLLDEEQVHTSDVINAKMKKDYGEPLKDPTPYR